MFKSQQIKQTEKLIINELRSTMTFNDSNVSESNVVIMNTWLAVELENNPDELWIPITVATKHHEKQRQVFS